MSELTSFQFMFAIDSHESLRVSRKWRQRHPIQWPRLFSDPMDPPPLD